MGHPDEVDEIFDLISYCKGASVIRMLHDFIGDDVSQSKMVHLWRQVVKPVYKDHSKVKGD